MEHIKLFEEFIYEDELNESWVEIAMGVAGGLVALKVGAYVLGTLLKAGKNKLEKSIENDAIKKELEKTKKIIQDNFKDDSKLKILVDRYSNLDQNFSNEVEIEKKKKRENGTAKEYENKMFGANRYYMDTEIKGWSERYDALNKLDDYIKEVLQNKDKSASFEYAKIRKNIITLTKEELSKQK